MFAFKQIFILLLVLACGSAHAALKIQTWALANGARVFFVENHSIPLFDVSIEFDAGSRRDPQGKAGTASLTNAMLARGLSEGRAPDNSVEPALNEAQISDAFADTAAQRGGGAGNDRAGASLRSLSSPSERDASIRLLARILAQPDFPANFFERDKARTISAIKEDLTKPASIAGKAFWRVAYGTHPYAMETTVASVEAIKREDLIEFHRQHYVANRAVIAMIGDITRAEADAIARQMTMRLANPEGTNRQCSQGSARRVVGIFARRTDRDGVKGGERQSDRRFPAAYR